MDTFKSGKFYQQNGYKSFLPAKINKQWIISNPEIQTLLEKANCELGKLDMFSEYLPNVDLFIYLHTVKEATLSSKIEGTKTQAEELFIKNYNTNPEKRLDKIEVQNYINALNEGNKQLSHLPLSTRLIKKLHRTLMQGVRGENKTPGEFRRSQNWIGGATLKDAIFVPPPHYELNSLLSDLENFIYNDEIQVPHLIKIAIIHYQFETIHPFLDGNGRVGRLIIPLYLAENNYLKKPVLYLSDYLEKHRLLYYDHLMNTRIKSDFTDWFKFFLVGIIETTHNGIKTFNSIIELQKQIEIKISTLGKRKLFAQKLIDYLYQNQYINGLNTVKVLKTTMPTANKLLSDMEKLNILIEVTGKRRNRLYVFSDYMKCFFNDFLISFK